MKKNKKIALYVALLILSIVIFTLAIIFDASGIFGLIITIFCIYLFIGSIVKLCRLNSKLKSSVLNFIDVLFWLP